MWTITSEIVPVHKRAHWSQALSVESCLLSRTSLETERSHCSSPGRLLLSPAPCWVGYLVVRNFAIQLNSMGQSSLQIDNTRPIFNWRCSCTCKFLLFIKPLALTRDPVPSLHEHSDLRDRNHRVEHLSPVCRPGQELQHVMA